MRVAHVTSAHGASDVRILRKECVSLSRAGHDVHLVAPHPGPSDGDQVEGVQIHGFQAPTGRMLRMTVGTLAAVREARRIHADCYHLHDPELLPWVPFLKSTGAIVVYDSHEDLPRQVLAKNWLPVLVRPLISRCTSLMLRIIEPLLDAVVAATPRIRSTFGSRTVLVRNFPDLAEFSSMSTRAQHSVLRFVYVGALSEDRGLFHMIQGIAKVRAPNVVLTIAGSGPLTDIKNDPSLSSAPVEWPGWLDRRGIVELMASAYAGLVLLHPTPAYVDALPVKMFEYMASGLPVIASDFPLLRGIVSEARCGLLVDPLDSTAIADAMTWLVDNPSIAKEMGVRGRKAALRLYSWDTESRALVGLYDTLASGLSRRKPARKSEE
jgi:glycosyltransferase involved in cell wall biosynthesis